MSRLTLIFLFFAFILFGTSAVAQSDHHSKEKRENIESAKIAFLTDKMELTPEQSQKFWPIYNEYQSKKRQFFKEYKSAHRRNVDEMSEQEVKTMVDNIFDTREKELALEKEYAAKYQKVISVKQLVKLYRAEHEFTKLLLKRLDARK